MKKILNFILLLSLLSGFVACNSAEDKKKEDPNKAPMFRPLEHQKDSARA